MNTLKRIMIALLLLTFFLAEVRAQIAPLQWQWAQGTVCRSTVEGGGLAGDSHGNALVCGSFYQDSIVFGNITVNSIFQNGNYYIAKYDPTGQPIWAHGITYDFLCGYMYGLRTDPADNIWAIAFMWADTFENSAYYDLVKYNSMGQISWKDTVRLAHGAVRYLATDQNGSGYLGGDFKDSAKLGNYVLHCPPGGQSDGYLAKYRPSGTVAWAKTLESDTTANCDVHYTSTSRQGYVYASGAYFAPAMHIDADTFHMPVPYRFPTSGNMNPLCSYIAKLDTNGHVKWIRGVSVMPEEYGFVSAIHADENDNLWVSGGYSGDSILIDNYMLHSPAGQPGYNFLAKLDTGGHVIWAKYYSSTNNFNAIETDRGGNAYISGVCNSYLVLDADTLRPVGMPVLGGARFGSFVMVVDPNGNNKCATPFYDGGRYPTMVAKDPADNFFFSGNFDSTFVIAGDTLRSGSLPQKDRRSFVARFTDCTPTGINNPVNLSPGLRLRPNPSSGAAIASFALPEGSANATLCITDMLGKEIERYTLQSSQTEVVVDVHGMSSGIYIVSLMTGGRVVASQKMAVE